MLLRFVFHQKRGTLLASFKVTMQLLIFLMKDKNGFVNWYIYYVVTGATLGLLFKCYDLKYMLIC